MSNCQSCPTRGSCSKDQEKCGIKNNPNNKIKSVIGVMSGKGGVGKSSISALIAKQLAALGYKVGVLDADITGPSIPRLLHVTDKRATTDGENIIPIETVEGIKVISLNLLIDDETQPVVWRGPMVANVIKQFWEEVLWGELDYLVIDMPPGTGDVPLTIGQSIPVNGMVMVSVPQDLISMIVTKAIHMMNKLDVKVLGVIENMSYISCPDCHQKIKFYEEDDTAEFLKNMDLELLGELPMVKSISNLSRSQYQQSEESLEMIAPIVDKILKAL